MQANEVYLMAKYDQKTPGPRIRNLVAEDLIAQYMRVLEEELINDRVTVTKINDIHDLSAPNGLLVVCSMGENFAKTAVKNLGRIYGSANPDDPLIRGVKETLAHWGKLYSPTHGVQNPRLKGAPSGHYLELEPFQINAPGAAELAPYLGRLGRELATVIADLMTRKRRIYSSGM